MSPPPAPDGGFWAYTAVFACFMGNVIGDGIMYSFGIFMPKLKDYFKAGSGEVSTINSIQMGVTFASGPVASFMTNKLGWRLTTVIGSVLVSAGLALSAVAPNVYFLYFSAGIVLGLGLGIIYLPRLDCITQYFDKKRPFVTGIAICGSGIGTFVFAPLTEWLLNTYSWQTALLILSVICASNIFFGLLFKPLINSKENEKEICQKEMEFRIQNGNGNSEDQEDKSTFKDMLLLLRNWVFMMFAVSNFLTSLGYPIPYTFVPDNAAQQGLSGLQGSSLVSIIGITNTVARIILGIVSLKLNRLFLYNTCLVICGISMCLTNYFQPILVGLSDVTCPTISTSLLNSTIPLLENSKEVSNITFEDNSMDTLSNFTMEEMEPVHWACDQYIGQLIYANLYGVTSAAYVLLTTLVLADLLGADKFTNAFGLLLLFQGVATFIGPPIVGFMFDAYNSYNPGFIVMGLMISLSGLILYPIPYIKRWLDRGKYSKSNIELE